MMREGRIAIDCEADIVSARQRGRAVAAARGFSATDQTLIATAISEIARNIIAYAERGEIVIGSVDAAGRRGIQVVARDDGPGIAEPELAMRDGYSTGQSLGLGLPGARRLMDEFELVSGLGRGTIVSMRKWVR